MKIAYFSNNYFPYISGVSVSIEGFRCQLEKNGVKVYVFAPRFGKIKRKKDSTKILRYPSVQTNFKTPFPVAIKPSFRIGKAIKKIDPDIFHAHHPFWLGEEALKYAKRKNKPLVFTAHTNFEHYLHYIPFFPQNLVLQWVKKKRIKFCNECNLVIAPTEPIKKELIKEGVLTRIAVIPSGINLTEPRKEEVREKRKEFNIQDNDKVLLFLGRVEKEKNLELLIKIIPPILEKYPLTKFLIVGSGEMEKEFHKMKEKYPHSLIVTGGVAYDKISVYYQMADIFLQPSYSETQGLTTIEALSSGLAVVAVGGEVTEEFVKNDKNGIIAGSKEINFLRAIESLLLDEGKLKIFQKNAQQSVDHYQIANCAQRLMEEYKKLI